MNLELIKQKINLGEGFVKRLDTEEIITAKKYNELTNKKHPDYESNNISIYRTFSQISKI